MNNFIHPFLFLTLFVISCTDSNNNPTNGNILGSSQSSGSEVKSPPEMSSAKSIMLNSSNTKQGAPTEKNLQQNSSSSLKASTYNSSEATMSSSSTTQQIFVESEQKIIGYFAAWRETLPTESMLGLTHAIVTGLRLDTQKLDGSLDTTSNPRMMYHIREMNLAKPKNTKIMVMVGGWGGSEGFSETAATEASRKNFAQNLTSFCLNHQLAGADIDWEFPANDEFETYLLMIQELRTEFDKHGLLLTAALGQDHGHLFLEETWNLLDWVNIMAYDMNWAAPGKRVGGNHAPADLALTLLPKWENYDIPKNKLILGLPFYGRETQSWGTADSYANIYQQHSPQDSDDEIGGFNYNGPQTIFTKSKYVAENKYGGVMIWEIPHDLEFTHEKSLLRQVNIALGRLQ
jgi:GH18 family chitinase